ncbi:MAG TPA: hypothetical protein VHO28_13145 [Ignavibacteriales bacterium]|nr:hypothetical protein [Ignavibacteriales bacterium]
MTIDSEIANENFSEDFKSLEEMERVHMITALRMTNGLISGEKGAGKLLGINSKTLDSRIKKQCIKKEIIVR